MKIVNEDLMACTKCGIIVLKEIAKLKKRCAVCRTKFSDTTK